MLTKEELAGIIDAMGALNLGEITSLVNELASLRGEEEPSPESITELCQSAHEDHFLEMVTSEEVECVVHDNSSYYISGPNAFQDIPSELSEVIDILEMSKREVNLSKVAHRVSRNLQKRIKNLEERICSFKGVAITASEMSTLEQRYSTLLNLYYDYDFWLPGSMEALEDELRALSDKLVDMKAESAQGI